MRLLIASLATIAASLGAECPPSPQPAPTPAPSFDAGPNATPTQRACGNLASLGCAEGADDKCVAVLDHAIAVRLTTFDLKCLAEAQTKAAVRECGKHNVACD